MNYWNSLPDSLRSLMREGYCFLPAIKDLFQRDDIATQCEHEIGNRTYAENLETHKKFALESGISSVLSSALFALARDTFGYRGSKDNQYHISRLVRPGDISEGYRGHFDSHLFTLVVPIKISVNEKVDRAGDLLFYPAARREPRNEISNFAGKLNFKRYAHKSGFDRLAQTCEQKIASFEDYRPLLFLGRQTFHGNMPLDASSSGNRLTL